MKVRRELTAVMVGRRNDGYDERIGGKQSLLPRREKRGDFYKNSSNPQKGDRISKW